MQAVVRVVNAGWAYQRQHDAECRGTVEVCKADVVHGRRVVMQKGHHAWKGETYAQPIEGMRRDGEVIVFNAEMAQGGMEWLKSVRIIRGGLVRLPFIWIVAKAEDWAAAEALAERIRRMAEEAHDELSFVGEAEEEKPAEVVPVIRAKHAQEVARDVFGESLLMSKPARVEALRSVCVRAARIAPKYVEGNRRFKTAIRSNAGRWLIEHGMVEAPYQPLETCGEPDDRRKVVSARVVGLGAAIVSVGTKRPRFSQMPGDPDAVMAECDRRAEYVQRMLDREMRPMAA